MSTPGNGKREKRLHLFKHASGLRPVRLINPPAAPEATHPPRSDASHALLPTRTVENSANRLPRLASLRPLLASSRSWLPQRREARRSENDPLADWQHWSSFRLWRYTRPFWGSVLMILAALILLAFPASLLQFSFLVSTLWASLVVGGLILVMGLIQLFLPSYAVITGSIGLVLSLASFITNTFGGLALGMLLGIIGCSLSIAWRPVKRSRLLAASRSLTKS